MNTPSDSTGTAAPPLPPPAPPPPPLAPDASAVPAATHDAGAEESGPVDQSDSVIIGLRNDLHWLRTRLALAAGSAPLPVVVSVYWPAANAGAGGSGLPAVAFETKTLVDAGGRTRERDARLLLQDGKVIVAPLKDTDHPLRVLAYSDVMSISYSHARDPLWSSPKGPAPAARAAGGGLDRIGIAIRRHWIALETAAAADAANRFVVLQASDQTVRSILAALQQRTGRTPQTVGER